MDLKQSLYVISRPPSQQLNNRQKNIKSKNTRFNEGSSMVTYKHLKIVNNPVFKNIHLFSTCFFYALQWNFKNRKHVRAIICDPLNLSVSIAALIIGKTFNVKSIAIVTDLPDYMEHYSVKKETFPGNVFSKCYSRICNFFMKRYDSYILLTEQMNELVNPYRKSYIVIEGLVDSNMRNIPNVLEDKYKEKIVIYAGALYEKYGVKKLIEAFME